MYLFSNCTVQKLFFSIFVHFFSKQMARAEGVFFLTVLSETHEYITRCHFCLKTAIDADFYLVNLWKIPLFNATKFTFAQILSRFIKILVD